MRQPDAEIVLVGFEHLVAEGGRRARHRQLDVQRTVLEAAALALEAHRNALRVVRAVEIAAADLAELHVDQLAFVHHAFIRHVKDRGLDKHLRHRIGAETAVGRAEATVHLDDLPIVNLDAVNDLLRTRKVMRPLSRFRSCLPAHRAANSCDWDTRWIRCKRHRDIGLLVAGDPHLGF